jgi:hypothetical protein
MKIRAQLRDGTMETITIVPPVTVFDKIGFNLLHLSCGDGMDHYFTLDGHYDGWGRGFGCGATEAEAKEIIGSVEESREIERQKEEEGSK